MNVCALAPRRVVALVIGLLLLAVTSAPGAAAAGGRLSLVDLTVSVSGAAVSARSTVRASANVEARYFGVCMRDRAGRNLDFWKVPASITSRGTQSVPDTKVLAPGTYRVFACVLVDAGWVNLGDKTIVIRATGLTSPTAPRGVGGAWQLDFSDDFDRPALDARWSTGWFGAGVTQPVNASEDQCYAPSQVRLPGDGTLTLALRKQSTWCGGRQRSHVSGLVSTFGAYTFRYGAVESRVLLPSDSNDRLVNWPAFWTNGEHWPGDGENDVMEVIDGRLGAHYHSGSGEAHRWVDGARGGWHTFTSVWEPGRVTYYYDGLEIGTVGGPVSGAPHYLVLDLAAARTGQTVPADLKVDYVRVWRR